jgi:MFS family permease
LTALFRLNVVVGGKTVCEGIMKESGENATKSWVLALTSVASSMVALDALVVATALSVIRRDLGASIEVQEWAVNAYNLSFAVLLLSGAALGDRFGRRRVFVVGLSLFVTASISSPRRSLARWPAASAG